MRYCGACSLPFFPSELVDHTIDYLHQDKASLKACSLVSRRWLNSTRHHLFRSTVVVGNSRPGHGFAEFRQFLLDHPHIGLHVHELRLQGEVNLLSGRPQICKHEMQDLMQHLPHLQKFDLFGVRFGGCDEECVGRAFVPKPVSLDQVAVVAGSDEDELADILDLLRLFGDVQHFYVYELIWRTDDTPNLQLFEQRLSKLGPPSQLQIHSLASGHAYNPTSSLFCHILRFTQTVHTLSAIGAECAGWDHIEALGALLHDLGPTILHFHLDVALFLMDDQLWSADHTRWRSLSMNCCPSLKSISLMLLLDDQSYIDDLSAGERLYASTNILDMLSTVSDSRTLRQITIKLAFEAEEETPAQILTDSVDWVRMAELLNGLVNLQKVSLIFTDGPFVLEECQSVVLEKLRQFDDRGMLDIKVLNEENLPPGAKI